MFQQHPSPDYTYFKPSEDGNSFVQCEWDEVNFNNPQYIIGNKTQSGLLISTILRAMVHKKEDKQTPYETRVLLPHHETLTGYLTVYKKTYSTKAEALDGHQQALMQHDFEEDEFDLILRVKKGKQ